jgi:hypothetical protein
VVLILLRFVTQSATSPVQPPLRSNFQQREESGLSRRTLPARFVER